MGEKSRPVIGKLMEALGSDGFSSDSATSPRSPLDLMILSPRGLMKCDFSGIGLGIVAAMDNGGRHFSDTNKAAFGRIRIPKTGDEDEDYTCVISHGGPNKSFSKRVYFHEDIRKRGQTNKKLVPSCMFYISQDGISDDLPAPASDSFLILCDHCRKGLQGKDIYMYRGERGFCSEECRDAAMQVKAIGTNSIWSAAAADNNHIESRSDRIWCTRDRVLAA